MANIIPQYKWINRKTWVKSEKYERQVARKLGSVTVINGVIYGDYSKRMRKSGIAYPIAYWKMLYDNHDFERCFYYENDSHAKIKGDKLRIMWLIVKGLINLISSVGFRRRPQAVIH